MTAPPEILVVGAGSAGARHARLLLELGARVWLADPDDGRVASVDGARVASPDPDRWPGAAGIVIATPTILHHEHALAALATGAKVLVEKPLAATAAEVADLVDASDRVMVGFNLRLHDPNVALHRLVTSGRVGRVCSLRLWFGSWLPDWRPRVDYRTTYSARRALGGGVLLDAIHELDQAVWFAGTELAVRGAVVNRVGPLDIDVEDSVHALLQAPGGPAVTVELDYLSRRYRRGIEVIGDEATARLDWARSVLEIEDGDEVHATPAPPDPIASYRAQARRFLDFVTLDAAQPVDALEGAVSVRLAEAVREIASPLTAS